MEVFKVLSSLSRGKGVPNITEAKVNHVTLRSLKYCVLRPTVLAVESQARLCFEKG